MPEAKSSSPLAFLRGTPVLVVSALLLAEIIIFYTVPKAEFTPRPRPLDSFNAQVGQWQKVKDIPIGADTQEFLKADDTLTRNYSGPGDPELFVAFYRSQRGGVATHSPKVCLPGNGWTPETERIITVDVPGEPKPITLDRMLISHDGDRKLVLYWYENPFRTTANEYLSKFYLIWDSLRFHRSDEAMIRVIVNLDQAGQDDNLHESQAIQFIRAIFQPLKKQMWVMPNSNQQAAISSQQSAVSN